MEITAKQGVLDKLVKRADPFTAKDLGSGQHLHSIFIEADADSGTVHFTAENDASAIEFTVSEGIDIKESGRLLIDSVRLRTILGVIESDERVTIKSTSNERVLISGGRTNVRPPATLIEGDSAKVLLPRVHSAVEKGIKIKGDDFREAFQTGIVARDSTGRRPALNAVHIELTENKALRFLSFNMIATAFATANVEKADAKKFVTLVDPNQIWPTIDYISQGDSVILSTGQDDAASKQLHLTVVENGGKGKEPKVLYHIRINTIAGGSAEFPAEQILGRVRTVFSGVTESFTVDRDGLLRLFRSAERIASLNHSGRGKDVEVALTKKDLRVAVSGEVDFEDFVSLKKWSGEKETFIFRWGLYGDALETYPGDEEFQVGIIRKPGEDGRVIALVLVNNEDVKFNGKDDFPEEYMVIVPTATDS